MPGISEHSAINYSALIAVLDILVVVPSLRGGIYEGKENRLRNSTECIDWGTIFKVYMKGIRCPIITNLSNCSGTYINPFCHACLLD